MNLTIIGASAGVGLETARRTLQRGHSVTTLARSPIAVDDAPNLHKIQGSALHAVDLRAALAHADALIVALGTGKSTKPTTLYSDFARLLLEVHRNTPLTMPVVVLTGFGAGDSGRYHDSLVMRLVFKHLLNDVYADKTRMEQMIAASDMRWTMVRPGLLKNRPLSERYRVETALYKGVNIGAIARADVADFMVKQAEKPTHVRQYPALSQR